jgi:hypothetical protein
METNNCVHIFIPYGELKRPHTRREFGTDIYHRDFFALTPCSYHINIRRESGEIEVGMRINPFHVILSHTKPFS